MVGGATSLFVKMGPFHFFQEQLVADGVCLAHPLCGSPGIIIGIGSIMLIIFNLHIVKIVCLEHLLQVMVLGNANLVE